MHRLAQSERRQQRDAAAIVPAIAPVVLAA